MKSRDITLKQIEMFLAVAEQENLTSAARDAHLDPAAVSRMITKLEESLGTTLFIRKNHGVTLTEEGVHVYGTLKPILTRFQTTLDLLHDRYEKAANYIQIGIQSANEMTSVANSIISLFKTKMPGIIPSVEYQDIRILQEGLFYGKYDGLFCYSHGFGSYHNIDSIRLRNFDSYLAVSAENPAVTDAGLNKELLNGCCVYRMTMSEMQRSEIELKKMLSDFGIKVGDFRYVLNDSSLQHSVRNNMGITVCGKDLFKEDWPHVVSYKMGKIGTYQQSMIFAWNKDRRSENLNQIIRFLKENKLAIQKM